MNLVAKENARTTYPYRSSEATVENALRSMTVWVGRQVVGNSIMVWTPVLLGNRLSFLGAVMKGALHLDIFSTCIGIPL